MMELVSSDSDGELNFLFVCMRKNNATQCVHFLLDSNMELQASSTDDIASNSGSDADIAVFDTDLPAEHNVSCNFCVY